MKMANDRWPTANSRRPMADGPSLMTIANIKRPKGLKILKTELSVTDGQTDGRTDKPAYRDARRHLKRK